MISATRREALIGALTVPAVAGLPGEALAIEGDRIRFARAVFERRPSLVVGISRPADALLIEEVGREAGYVPVSEGIEALKGVIVGTRPRDRGLVLGWVLAPRT